MSRVAAFLLVLMAAVAQASPTVGVAVGPTIAEATFYARPLVKARLRLPESLHALLIRSIAPRPEEPSRFVVTVQFRAKTPFGAITEHSVQFNMKRAASQKGWIVTTE